MNMDDLSLETCCKCGVVFALMKSHVDTLRRCKNTFFCPNGHGQAYSGDTEVQKLRKILAEKDSALLEKQRRVWDLERSVEREQKSRRALRGRITKLVNDKGERLRK